ncbi:MAG: translation initiation factor IF-3 [Holosporales bacterium]|nr:translation initiation factor IF-3 [Holosporales bacterium]
MEREKTITVALDKPSKRSAAAGECRVNLAITARDVRLVGKDGTMLGIVSRREALDQANIAGLDLVEISPTAVPPVCKILDYGKFRYEMQKRRAEAKKKQHIVDVKEVKLTPTIGEHDFRVKLASVYKFLEAENKVKVSLRFRGREMMHQELGLNLLNRLKEELGSLAKVDQAPQLEGRSLLMILSSAKSKA